MSAAYALLAEKLAEVLASPGGQKVLQVATDPLATRDDVAKAISTMSEMAARPKGSSMPENDEPLKYVAPITVHPTGINVPVTLATGATVQGIEWAEVLAWAPAVVEIYATAKAAWNTRPAEESKALRFTYAVEAAFPRAIALTRQIIADWTD